MSTPSNELDDQKSPSSSHVSGSSSSRSKSKNSKRDRSGKSSSRSRGRGQRSHRRKLSNASIMSIDPYVLVQLKNSQSSGNIKPLNDPTKNQSQYANDLDRAWNQMSGNQGSDNNNNMNNNNNNQGNQEIDAERERLIREAAEESIKISLLEPTLEKAREEYRELWEEKEQVELELEQIKRDKNMLKEQYDAKLDELEKQIYDLQNNNEMNTEIQVNENDRLLKEEFSAKIKFMEEDYQKAINNYEMTLQRTKNELQQAYKVETTLRESIENYANENNQLQLQINESNKLHQKFRMLQRKFDESMKENNDLRNEIYKMQTEKEELIGHNNYLRESLDQATTEQHNTRNDTHTSFDTEIIGAMGSTENKRNSIDKQSNHSSIRGAFHMKGMMTMDLASQLENQNIADMAVPLSPKETIHEASEEHKVADNDPLPTKTKSDNDKDKDGGASSASGSSETGSTASDENNNNNNNNKSDESNADTKNQSSNQQNEQSTQNTNQQNDAPTSWAQIANGLNSKPSGGGGRGSRRASSGKPHKHGHHGQSGSQRIGTIDEFSMVSQYSDSHTDVGDRLDEINNDMKEMKDMLEQLLNTQSGGTGPVNNELKTNLALIYRDIRKIQIMIGRDGRGINNNNNNNDYNNSTFNMSNGDFSGFINARYNSTDQQQIGGVFDEHGRTNSNMTDSSGRLLENRGNIIFSQRGGINRQHDRDLSHTGSSPNVDDRSEHSGSYEDMSMYSAGGMSGWMAWIFGDSPSYRKKSFIREYGPPLAFSSIIIAAAYLILVYQRGQQVVGKPKVLRR